jgi:hypothetical protein
MIGTSKSVWGFDPRSVPGCQLWLDAADQNAMTLSGSSVVTILDKSGNGKTLSGGTGWTYNVTKFNGSYPSFYRATKGSMLGQNNTFSITSTNITVFFVGEVINNGGEYYLVDGGSAGTNRFYTIIDTSTTNIVHGNTVNAGNNYSLPSTVFKPFIFSQSTGTSPQTGSYNGTEIIASAGTVGTITWSGITVGGRFTNASDWFSGHICEVLIYTTLLTTSQRQQVEGYLAHKWGLVPYYDSGTPLSIPGCQLWLDGADPAGTGTPPANGTILSTWADKSGNGRNITATGTGPTYTTNTFNGYSAPVFNGTIMRTPSYLISTDSKLSIFVLCKKTGSRQTGENSGILGITAGYQYFYLYIRTSVTNYLEATYQLNVLEFTNYSISDGSTLLMTFLANGLSTSGYLNGTSVFNTSVTNNGYSMNNLTSQWIIGEGQFVGPICEIIIFNSTFTNAQRETIEGYLTRKWGLTTLYRAIPSTHPFSSVRPHLRPFQPTDVPGCQLWLDGADSSTVTGTTSVTQWRDKSGNARHLGVGSGTTSYSSSAIVLNSSYMFVNSPVNLTNVTVFIVSKSTGVTNQTILGAKPNTDYVYNSVDGFGFYNDPPTGRIRFYGQGNDPNQSIFFTDTSITKLYTFQSTGTTVSGWLNGTSQSGGTLTTTRTSTAQGFAIGAEWGGSSYVNIWVTASIYEILVYNTALTVSERQQVEGYLAHKWGLTPSLPVISPLSIPGCQLWFDAADSSTITFSSGSNVSVWTNKGIVSTTAIPTRGASANQITYVTVDGYPGVYINNNSSVVYNSSTYSQLTIQSNFQNTADYSIFAVVNLSNVTSGELQTIYGNSRGTSGETRTPNFGAGATLEFNSDNTNRMINSSFIGSGRLQTALVSSSSALTAYTNATAYASNTNGFTRVTTDTGALPSIGGPGSFNDNRFSTGYFHEILFYNSALTTSERQQVEGYLARKWGISISATLPSPHSFKSFPPASLPFSPRNISGLALWLDGADQSSMTLSGSNVTAWNDKSGNGYVMTNNGGTTTIATASLNSLTTVYTPSGTNTRITNFVGRTKCTIFLVGKAASSRYLLALNGGFLYTANDSLLYFSPPTGDYLDLVDSVSGSIVSNNTWFILCIGYDNATNSTANPYTINGTTRSTTITPRGTPGILTDQNITSTLYINSINGTNSYDSVYTAEILYYNDTLTTSQRQQVEGYLAHKWGMSASLPSTHPYSKFPPP